MAWALACRSTPSGPWGSAPNVQRPRSIVAQVARGHRQPERVGWALGCMAKCSRDGPSLFGKRAWPSGPHISRAFYKFVLLVVRSAGAARAEWVAGAHFVSALRGSGLRYHVSRMRSSAQTKAMRQVAGIGVGIFAETQRGEREMRPRMRARSTPEQSAMSGCRSVAVTRWRFTQLRNYGSAPLAWRSAKALFSSLIASPTRGKCLVKHIGGFWRLN